MKKFYRILLLATALCLALSLVLFAACRDKTATLTLDVADGGTISQSAIKVNVGDKLSDALSGVQPTPQSGLTFVGWYEGDKPVDENRTMLQEGLTLTAKYNASYTLNVYYAVRGGSYSNEPSDTLQGTAMWHEPFTVDVSGLLGETDNTQNNKLSVTSLQKDEVFTVYRSGDTARVVFDLNLSDAESDARTFNKDVLLGSSFSLPNGDQFGAEQSLRFVGWSATANGAIEYFEGDGFTASQYQTRLYAQWERGLTDIFDGDDYLFVSRTQKGVVYLRRHGIEEKTGVYNSETGAFSFENGLDGKVVDGSFYYYRDTMHREYVDYNGTEAKLTLKEGGAATYVNGDVTYNGVYDVEKDSGFYLFKSEGLTFRFVLRSSGTAVSFQRQDTDLEGHYVLQNEGNYSYPMLYLNGVGVATYLMDQDTYEATYNNVPILQYTGTYAQTHIEGIYEVNLYYYSVRMKQLFVRFTQQQIDSFESAKGYYQLNDGFTGEFTPVNNGSKKLSLDGFGEGDYDGTHGTYKVINNTWQYWDPSFADSAQTVEEMLTSQTYYVQYVEFTPQGAQQPIVFFIWDGRELDWFGDEDPDGAIVSYYTVVDADEVYGRFNVTNDLQMDGYRQSDAFVYIYPEGPYSGYKPQVWIPMYYLDSSGTNIVYMLGDTFTTLNNADGYLTLSKRYLNEDYDYVTVTMRFAFNKGASLHQTGSLEYVAEAMNVDTDLVIDEKGVAHCGNQVVDYTFDSEVVDIYTFTIGDEQRVYYLIEGTFYRIDQNKIYEESFVHPARDSGYTADLVYVTDQLAVVRVQGQSTSGAISMYCAILGNVTAADGKTDEYNFEGTLNDLPSVDALSIYDHFRYRLAEGKFERHDGTDLTAEGLTLDGYGTAQYNDGATTRSGSYAILENVVLFKDGNGELALKIEEGKVKQVDIDEVGVYYSLASDGSVSANEYYFLDGDGNAVYTVYSADAAGFVVKDGTYERLAQSALTGFNEYVVTFAADDLAHIVTAKMDEEARSVGMFSARNEAYLADVKIVDNSGKEIGRLFCNGYTLGSITLNGSTRDAQVMRCTINDQDVSDDLDYELNAEGEQLVAVLSDGTMLVFDLSNGNALQRELPYGTYMRIERGLTSDETIYLDGHGVATRFDGDGEQIEQGTYTWHNDQTELFYTGEKGSFVFVLQQTSAGLAYLVFEEDHLATLVSPTDWSSLILDGYGEAVYTDKYGVSGSGTYTFVTDWLVQFQSDALSHALYFDANLTTNTQQVFTDDFVARDGILYAYTGSESSVTIPDGITRIYANAFTNSVVQHVNFKGVTRIDSGAFAASQIEKVDSDQLLFIGEGAFRGCRFLEEVNIVGVTEIASEAFYYCTALKQVTLGAIQSIGDRAFSEFKSDATEAIRFDLTAVESVADITLGSDVFMAFYNNEDIDEGIAIAIIVADIDDMNEVLFGEAWALVKDSVSFPIGQENGRRYIDLDSGDVYELHNGYLSLVVTGSYTLKYTNLGLYTLSDGEITLYTIGVDGTYSVSVKLGSKVLAYQNKLLWQLDELYTLKVNDKDLTFTVKANYDTYNYYFATTFQGDYNGNELGEGSTFDKASGNVLLVLGSDYYALKVTDSASGTLTLLGQSHTFEGEPQDATHGLYAWRLTAVTNEGKLALVLKFEVKASAYSYSYASYAVVSVTEREDSSILLETNYYGTIKYYLITLDGDTCDVTLYGELSNASSDDYSVTFVSDPDHNVLQLLTFSIDGKEVEFTATSNADGSFTVKVGEDTYKVTCQYTWMWMLTVEKVQ